MDALPTECEIVATAAWIAAVQRSDGLIPWVVGGAADPWNHVESAMALDVAGRHQDARRAYEYLLGRQRPDGAFVVDLTGGDAGRIDTNAVAYLGAGLLHHLIATGDGEFCRAAFPLLADAIEYVLGRQLPGGAVAWNVDPDGVASTKALVAGSSSIALSLRSSARLGRLLGFPRDGWEIAGAAISVAVRKRASEFFDKSEFAMDWYYPVLSNAVVGRAASEHLDRDGELFVTSDGVRCRSDGRWVTTAETAETAMAYWVAGDTDGASSVLETVADKRRQSGGYLTGLVYPERSEFPRGEETTYSAAAVLLATDLLRGGRATSAVFDPVRTRRRKEPVAASVSSTKDPDPTASM